MFAATLALVAPAPATARRPAAEAPLAPVDAPRPAPGAAPSPLWATDPAHERDLALVATAVEAAVGSDIARIRTRHTYRNLAAQARTVSWQLETPAWLDGRPLPAAGPDRAVLALAPDAEVVVETHASRALERAGRRYRLRLPLPDRADAGTLFSLRARIESPVPVHQLRSTHGARIRGEGSRAVEIEVRPALLDRPADYELTFTLDAVPAPAGALALEAAPGQRVRAPVGTGAHDRGEVQGERAGAEDSAPACTPSARTHARIDCLRALVAGYRVPAAEH